MGKDLLLIVNPRAGRRRSPAFFYDVFAILSRAGYRIRLRETAGPGDASRIAREEGADYDLVVCYGGDGTLNQTVSGLLELESPPPLGYLPGGSTNDFAASLNLPADPAQAARRIAEGEDHYLDVGRVNDRYFLYVATFGAFTKASYSAPQNVKNDLGHLAYIIEGIKDLSSLKFYPARVEADGEVLEGRYLFCAVANATSLGGVLKLRESLVSLDDGKFELILIPEPKSVLALNDTLRALLLRDFSGSPGLIMRHCAHIRVTTPEPLDWSLDGEQAAGVAQGDIETLHRRLRIRLS